jgi:hypothetical protein
MCKLLFLMMFHSNMHMIIGSKQMVIMAWEEEKQNNMIGAK